MGGKNLIFKSSSVLVCALFFLLFHPSSVHADSILLKVSPSVIRVEAKPPADVWTPFTIENLSNQPVSLKIGYRAFNPQLSSNGTVIFMTNEQQLPGADKNIFDKMQIVDDENISHDTVELGPQQQERLRLRILLPQDEPSSDYYFSLIFLGNITQTNLNSSIDNIEDQKSYSTIQDGIGLNVLLAVGNNESPNGIIQTFNTPLFSNDGPVPITLKVTNSGNHFIVPSGEITIKNMFGQSVGKITVPSSVVLAGTTRAFGNIELTTGNTLNTEQGFIWPGKLLVGIYTATLTLSMSTDGPVYVRSIRFICFPVVIFLVFIGILVIVIYSYLRVKRKLL